jgi:hypothetical protein
VRLEAPNGCVDQRIRKRANSVARTLLAMKRRMPAARGVVRCNAPTDRRSMHPLIGDGTRTDFGALQALAPRRLTNPSEAAIVLA